MVPAALEGTPTAAGYRSVQRKVKDARRFVFDDDAMRRIAHVCKTIPEFLLENSQFARSPFDDAPVWIEHEVAAYYEAMVGRAPDDLADKAAGFLIDGGTVYVVASGGGRPAALMPFTYELNTPWPVQDQIDFAEMCQTSRMQLDNFMWGSILSTYSTGNAGRDMDFRRGLRDRHSCRMVPWHNHVTDDLLGEGRGPKTRERLRTDGIRFVMSQLVTLGAGDMRTIVALLLFLNRPKITRFRYDIPGRRGFVGNKLRPFLSHRVVTVDLDGVNVVNQLHHDSLPDSAARRRHEVRGHWAHDEVKRRGDAMPGHVHDWRPDLDYLNPDGSPDDRHWQCAHCSGSRWWRRDHVRGSAAVGFVQHDNYEVTATGKSRGARRAKPAPVRAPDDTTF